MAKTKKAINKPKKQTTNKFAGADDVYTTNNKIAVRRIRSTVDKTGNITLTDTTRYFPKTKSNLKAARSAHGKLRAGRRK